MTAQPVLRRGATGDPVRDLQARLGSAGHPVPAEEAARFGAATEASVLAFQESRGLRADGICGPETFGALVESTFRLGDRLLYQRRPMLRGDDVAALQRRLNALGFDAGREDGIFGPHTEAALRQFQVNAGVAADGVAGPATCRALDRLDSLAGGSVASVRERETLLRGPRRLDGRRVFLAVEPGLDSLGDTIRGGLATAGAIVVLDASGGDDSTLAGGANDFGADVAAALRCEDAEGATCAFFATSTFRSEAGFLLATRIAEELAAVLGGAGKPAGKAYGFLRETRMAAVDCTLPAAVAARRPGELVGGSAAGYGELADAIVRGLRQWAESPLNARC